jgi:hypothetical protein
VTLLRDALGLWRGEPLGGLAGQWAVRTRQGWRQQHLDAVLAWARAELAVGNPAAVIGALTDLVGEHPLLEPLIAVLMRALYAAGHSAQALDLSTVTRQRLVQELGAEPGSELRQVQHGILRDDLDRHDMPPPPAVPAVAASVAPAQLPQDVPGFAGRQAALAQLDALLPAAGEPANTVVISAVSGTAGVGKTALAVYWAHQVRRRFPDGQLYVNLRGFDPSGSVMEPVEAVRGFLDALGVAPQRIPAGIDAQTALYRSLLAERRMLLVLDNACDAAQVRPLLPGAAGCLVLVTSRNRMSGLVATDGAHPLSLDLLTAAEARQLLARRLGADRIANEPRAVEEIIERCARLPLALTVVAARAATHPRFPLASLAADLRESNSGLDALAGGDPATDVRAVFSWSYRTLSAPAAWLFRLFGLHPGPDISLPAVASLAGLPPATVRPLLTELTRVHLVVEHVPGRYTLHDLLLAYAAAQANAIDPPEQREAATVRVLDHYLHSAHTAHLVLQPHREPITLAPPQPGVTPERPGTAETALAWFNTERPVLLAAIDRAARAEWDIYTCQLAWTVANYLYRQGHWHDQTTTAYAALAANRRLGDPSGQALSHRSVAHAYSRLGRYDDARTHLDHAPESLPRGRKRHRTGAHPPHDRHRLGDAAPPRRCTRPCPTGARGLRGRRPPPRAGARPDPDRAVPCPTRRPSAGSRLLPAGPCAAPGARQPARPGRDVGLRRLRPPPSRPARRGDPLLPVRPRAAPRPR